MPGVQASRISSNALPVSRAVPSLPRGRSTAQKVDALTRAGAPLPGDWQAPAGKLRTVGARPLKDAQCLWPRRSQARRFRSSGPFVLSAKTTTTFAHWREGLGMNTITIEAATPDSAVGLYAALALFGAELRRSEDGRRFIDVELRGGDRAIVEVLNAIERYVTQRNDGPAKVELDGHNYMLYAAT